MGDKTGIEWTDATWNPIVGCSIVSPGCTNCYAMKQAARIERMSPQSHYAGLTQASKGGPVWTGALALAPAHILAAPLKWKRPRRIFVNSMGDLFHESVADQWIDRVFAVMALSPQHTFQVLTKRAKRMREYCNDPQTPERVNKAMDDIAPAHWHDRELEDHGGWPLRNVWKGVSAEDQPRADERIPDLLATPAAVRFVSAEPLTGSIDFNKIDVATWLDSFLPESKRRDRHEYDPDMRWPLLRPFEHWPSGFSSPGLDWIIVGGESGPGARPMHPDWARSIRDQCAAAGVPFFFKQWGEFREFDTGSPEVEQIDNDSHAADASYAAAVNPSFVTQDGRHFARIGLPPETPARLIERVGKKAAGRLLDGVEHNAFPSPVPGEGPGVRGAP